jgi:hypothetical protein
MLESGVNCVGPCPLSKEQMAFVLEVSCFKLKLDSRKGEIMYDRRCKASRILFFGSRVATLTPWPLYCLETLWNKVPVLLEASLEAIAKSHDSK